jgi:hypothetical protein
MTRLGDTLPLTLALLILAWFGHDAGQRAAVVEMQAMTEVR